MLSYFSSESFVKVFMPDSTDLLHCFLFTFSAQRSTDTLLNHRHYQQIRPQLHQGHFHLKIFLLQVGHPYQLLHLAGDLKLARNTLQPFQKASVPPICRLKTLIGISKEQNWRT